jgi:hypothetical protein
VFRINTPTPEEMDIIGWSVCSFAVEDEDRNTERCFTSQSVGLISVLIIVAVLLVPRQHLKRAVQEVREKEKDEGTIII